MTDALSLFPHALPREEGEKEMEIFKRTMFSFLLVAGLSVAASAQKDQKPPPKEKPPVVKPAPKPPPPDNSNKGKHGGEAVIIWSRDEHSA